MPNAAYARLAALWFGLQFVWGAILAVSLQARSAALAPGDGLRAYALVAALGALVGMLVQLASGPIADRCYLRTGNRRIFYVAGAAVAGIAIAWFYLAPNYSQLVGAFFVLQFGMNIVTAPYAAIIPDYVEPERAGQASSWMGIFQAIGNAGGLLVAAFINSRMLVASLLILTLGAACIVTTRATLGATARAANIQLFRIGRDFRTLIVSRSAINLGFYTLLGFLFFFVEQSLKTPSAEVRTRTALLFLTFTLANVAGSLLAAKPADRYDKRTVVLAANGVIAIGLVALALAPNAGLAFVAAGVAGSAWGAYFIPTGRWRVRCYRAVPWALQWDCGTLPRRCLKYLRRCSRHQSSSA